MTTAGDVLSIKNREMVSVSPDTTVFEALRVMVDKKIGAVIIKEDDRIVGIWTERDLMRNTVTEGFEPKTARVGDLMATELRSAPYDDSVYRLQDKFLGLRLRHLLIEKDGEYVGLLSAGDVMQATLIEKTREIERLNALVSWEYYENWRWDRRK